MPWPMFCWETLGIHVDVTLTLTTLLNMEINSAQHFWDLLDKPVHSTEAPHHSLLDLVFPLLNVLVPDTTAHHQGSWGVQA